MGAATLFWNTIAKRYAKSPIADLAAYETKLAITRQYLTPDSRVLEIGCGTGSTALTHAPHVAHVDAWDTSKKMVDIANAKAKADAVTHAHFHVGDIFDSTAQPGSYDAILALNVLHLISDRHDRMQRTIDRAYDLLTPGGVFVASTACLTGWRWSLLAPAGWLGLLPRLNTFGRQELLERIARPGFDILTDVTPGSPSSVFTVAQKPVAP